MVRIVPRRAGNWTKCPLCGAYLPSANHLHLHITQRHPPQFGAGEPQQPILRHNDPLFQNFPHPQRVEALYNSNLSYILAPHNFSNSNIHVYNFPVAGSVTDNDIDTQMREIYHNENTQHAYKLDVSAGVILYNASRNLYRYFAPASNAYVLDDPLLVESRATLESTIDTLKQMDLDYMIRRFRPNLKFQVVMICNLEWHVYMLDVALTSLDLKFPSFIRNKRSIVSNYSQFEKSYAKCCFFVAYCQHKYSPDLSDVRRVKLRVKEALCTWIEYCERNNIPGYPRGKALPGKFPGLDWHLIDRFEDCFQINVNIMEVKSAKIIISRRRSEKKYVDCIYLNKWKNHVSYITNIDRLASKRLCAHCNKVFDHKNDCQRHERSCSSQTRFTFDGGGYKYHTSIFDQLEQLGVAVDPSEIKCNEFFMCFDMEAMLRKSLEITPSGKTRFVATHEPISVSIASNVEP